MASGSITRTLLWTLDWLGKAVRRQRSREEDDAKAEHLAVGTKGEEAAYFYLRQCGYTVVARNWRNSRRKGEIDIIAWEGETLCFVEVKTRTRKTMVPAETAVDRDKMKELSGMARLYLRQMPMGTKFRFDIVTVYLLAGLDPEISLFKDAFGWRTREYRGAATF
jgi:putative endonuclease